MECVVVCEAASRVLTGLRLHPNGRVWSKVGPLVWFSAGRRRRRDSEQTGQCSAVQ